MRLEKKLHLLKNFLYFLSLSLFQSVLEVKWVSVHYFLTIYRICIFVSLIENAEKSYIKIAIEDEIIETKNENVYKFV